MREERSSRTEGGGEREAAGGRRSAARLEADEADHDCDMIMFVVDREKIARLDEDRAVEAPGAAGQKEVRSRHRNRWVRFRAGDDPPPYGIDDDAWDVVRGRVGGEVMRRGERTMEEVLRVRLRSAVVDSSRRHRSGREMTGTQATMRRRGRRGANGRREQNCQSEARAMKLSPGGRDWRDKTHDRRPTTQDDEDDDE
ncbi:MAG: Phosphotransferase enzyme [Chaenotheca gracillima]|nr:MAG: Phosphotransferase enzyme [Chaenotheca gracillima]